MALRSSLFSGDARVEAIAVSDASNVKYGDRGAHVAKIQHALNVIEGLSLDEDGVYGAMTQKAVLDYKRVRNIINYSYQTRADAVVGKMTIAALDEELWRKEQEQPPEPSGPMTVRVLMPIRSPADEYRDTTPLASHSPMLSFAISQAMLNAAGLPAPAAAVQTTIGFNVASNATVDIGPGQIATVEVTGGANAQVYVLANVANVRDPTTGSSVSSISSQKQAIEIVGVAPGSTFVYFSRGTITLFLPVVVRNPGHARTKYVKTMQPHDHKPYPNWGKVCDEIEQPKDTPAGIFLAGLCAKKTPPEQFIGWAKSYLAALGGPASVEHLNWYLHGGGVDLLEDENIRKWIAADKKLRSTVATVVQMNKARKQPHTEEIWFGQADYGSDEHAFAFGTIDRLFIEFDINVRYVKIYFWDIYEWHPVCPACYGPAQPGDLRSGGKVRRDNSMHAAMVQMKDKGAKDYWMIGEATRPMSDFGI